MPRACSWADCDGDGDLDLAAGNRNQENRMYENGFLTRPSGLPESPVSPTIVQRPGIMDFAFFHSSAKCLPSPVAINHTLTAEQSDPARTLTAAYSTNDGGAWAPTTVTWTGGNQNVSSLPPARSTMSCGTPKQMSSPTTFTSSSASPFPARPPPAW